MPITFQSTLFTAQLDGHAAAGIKLGDGDEPIFWYQPQNSETWRVIYGDLSVRDIAPENLTQ